MSYALYIIAGLVIIGALYSIGIIGKPRAPLTPAAVMFIVIIDAAVITVLIMAALKLS